MSWEEVYRRTGETVEPEIPKLTGLFKASDVRRILDFGCSPGRHTLHFATNGFEVYGFAQYTNMIKHATDILNRENLSAKLITWEMTKTLPYESNFFDAVLAVRVISACVHKRYRENDG